MQQFHTDRDVLPPAWLMDVSVLSVCNFCLGAVFAFPETFWSYTLVGNFTPTQVQLIYCGMYSPWIIKPLFARIIDRGPLACETYVQLLMPLSALVWLAILLAHDLQVTIGMYVLDQMLISFADVALDTIMVKRCKLEKDNRSVQSHVLIWRSVGMAVGAYTGGLAKSVFGDIAVYGGSIVLAILFCAMACLLGDVRMSDEVDAPCPNIRAVWTPTLRMALAFTFMVHIVPDIGGLFDFFLISDLKFSPIILGSLDMIGYIACIAGSLLYSQSFHGRSNVVIIQVALAIIAVETVLPVGLIFGWNTSMGISTTHWAGLDGFFRAVPQRLLIMPINGAILEFCAKGHEGTVYAVFTALSNVATIAATMLGALFSHFLGLSKGNMYALWILFVVRGALFALLVPFARMLPSGKKAYTDAT